MLIKDRAVVALNLDQYNDWNSPEPVGLLNVEPPSNRQYVLRMLIKNDIGHDCKLPDDLNWCRPLLDEAICHQRNMGIHHQFVYLTVRNGAVTSITDDEWHVDGFSQRITHLPQQSYIWANNNGTQYLIKKVRVPDDFDSGRHNFIRFLQDNITEEDVIHSIPANELTCIDPYVIHRRPPLASESRCFVRISFLPIEINDINNSINPLIPTNYTREGVKGFRDKLETYPKKQIQPN